MFMTIQSVRRGRQRAPFGVHTAQGVENKELQTKWGVLLIGYMLSQRLRLIGQATKSDAAYSAALHKAWFLACIANACRSYALLGTPRSGLRGPGRGCQLRRLLELRRRRP